MTSSQPSLVRGLEAGSIAFTLLMSGRNFGKAVGMVWGDEVAAIVWPPFDTRECATVPCPALGRAVGMTLGGLDHTVGMIATELLGALMAALRRLAELEQVPVADVVARLIAEAKEADCG